MSHNGALFRIVPYGPSQVTSAAFQPAFPPTALANIQPKVVARSSGISPNYAIDIDLGADTIIQGVAALHTNLSMAGLWQIFGASAAQGPLGAFDAEPSDRRLFGQTDYVPFGTAPTTREGRRFGLALATSVHPVVRYVRVYLRDTATDFREIGTLLILQRLAMGQGWDENFELGSGRRVDDRSQIRPLPGGETAIERGGRVPQWRAAWSNMTEAQMRELWSLLMEVGTGAPILAAEFQDGSPGQAEALHYGLIQSIDFSERIQLDKNRIELRFQELL